MSKQKAVVIGISGCSSSGKTTLARLLRDIFPNSFILHEDDFYKPEDQLPVRDGLVDWDCPEAISVPDMERALSHIRATGTFPVSSPSRARSLTSRSNHGSLAGNDHSPPALLTTASSQPDLDSKEDQNSVGQCPVTDGKIAELKSRVDSWLRPGGSGSAVLGADADGPRLCLLDGFLLYCPQIGPAVMDAIDIKLFLLVSRARARQRREARDGYVTLEGFWKDPPGYVDKIVWPNYVDAHGWLFEGGDVEGELRSEILAESGIRAQLGKGLDVDMETTLEWAVDTIMKELESFGSAKS